jgi:hypothetical protein
LFNSHAFSVQKNTAAMHQKWTRTELIRGRKQSKYVVFPGKNDRMKCQIRNENTLITVSLSDRLEVTMIETDIDSRGTIVEEANPRGMQVKTKNL